MTIGSKFTTDEFRTAKKVAKALSDPNLRDNLIEHATRDLGTFDANLQEAMKVQLNSYLDNAIKVIDEAPTIKENLFSEEIMPSDVDIQKVGEKLSVIEYGTGAIMRGLFEGTLTRNEVAAFREYHPDQAIKLSQTFLQELGGPEGAKDLPQDQKELLGMIIGVDVVDPQVTGFIQEGHKKDKEDDEKPGPKPTPRWIEGKFPGTQLSGSRAVEKRRQTK